MERLWWKKGLEFDLELFKRTHFDWYTVDFGSAINPNFAKHLVKLQETGMKIMVHIPVAYSNLKYKDEYPFSILHQRLDTYDLFLKDVNDEYVDRGGTNRMIDLTSVNSILVLSNFYEEKFRGIYMDAGFMPDAIFVDYVIDSIAWAGDFYDGVYLDAKWKRGSYMLIVELRALFNDLVEEFEPHREEDIILNVNGWHRCPFADTITLEGVPHNYYKAKTWQEVYEDNGKYSYKELKERFDYPILLYPSGPSTYEAFMFAKTFDPTAIIYDRELVLGKYFPKLRTLKAKVEQFTCNE